jgi:acyl-CoA synthetase (AMP-forming)/AMP-acid ligase II
VTLWQYKQQFYFVNLGIRIFYVSSWGSIGLRLHAILSINYKNGTIYYLFETQSYFLMENHLYITQDRHRQTISLNLCNHGKFVDAQDISHALTAHLHRGTLVLQSLPHDLASSLVLGAWHAGWRVAILPPHLSTENQQLLLTQLETSILVSESSIDEVTVDRHNEYISLVNQNTESNSFSTWLANNCQSTNSFDAPSQIWTKTETAVILFTSGSTGTPKGVCHSLASILASAERFAKHFEISERDKLLNTALLHTTSGFRCSILVPIITGCQVNNLPVTGHIGKISELLDREQSTVMITGPNIIRHLSMLGDRIADYTSSLRFIFCGGAKLARQDREVLFAAISLKTIDSYGLTEAGGFIVTESAKSYDPASQSSGKACDRVILKVIDRDGVEHDRGSGQLRVYSPSLFLGYLGNPIEQQQYFDTGDLVDIDDLDRVTWLARLSSGIKATSTEWIYSETVDGWLRKNTSIEDVHISVLYDTYDPPQFKVEIAGIEIDRWSEWMSATYQQLLLDLGSDYRVISWVRVESIERSNLGKYEKSNY